MTAKFSSHVTLTLWILVCTKKRPENCKKTKKKKQIEKSQGAWIGKTEEDENGSDMVKLISTLISFTWPRIMMVVCYEAVVLPLREFCSTSLKFRSLQLRFT